MLKNQLKSFLFTCVLTVCACFLSTEQLNAQDIHYAQFYTDYLRLNPSMTGNFDGVYRFGANARSQWTSVPVPYQTASAYADFGIMKGERAVNWVGTGLRVLYDQAGDGALSFTEIQATLAFHQVLSPNLLLSLGGGGMYVQRTVDLNKLYFGDQWNGVDFEEGLNSAEDFTTNAYGFIDVQAGATLTYHFENLVNISAGGSMLHLNEPRATFTDGDNTIKRRLVTHLSGSILLNQFGLEPALYYTSQQKASEFMLGTNVFYQLGEAGYPAKPVRAYLGAWYRHSDALVFTTGFEMKAYRVLFSYDVNVSELSPRSRNRGGPELSIVHVGGVKKERTTLYCPRF